MPDFEIEVVDFEMQNGKESRYHHTHMPLQEYIATVEKCWKEGKATAYTPVKLYEHPMKKLLWELDRKKLGIK